MEQLKVFIVACLLGYCFPLSAADAAPDASGWYETFFRQQFVSLLIDDGGAHFITRTGGRKFCLGNPGSGSFNFETAFTLKGPGESFFSPDHHGVMKFTVVSLKSARLVLSYDNQTSAFGENNEEHGQITLEPFVNQ